MKKEHYILYIITIVCLGSALIGYLTVNCNKGIVNSNPGSAKSTRDAYFYLETSNFK